MRSLVERFVEWSGVKGETLAIIGIALFAAVVGAVMYEGLPQGLDIPSMFKRETVGERLRRECTSIVDEANGPGYLWAHSGANYFEWFEHLRPGALIPVGLTEAMDKQQTAEWQRRFDVRASIRGVQIKDCILERGKAGR